jgi:HSP20 family molecular chaperone IbpA
MFSSTFNQIPIRHFIMAKDGSPSGNSWNVQTLDSLMSILQADIPRRRSVDILDEILVHINRRLPRLLSSNNGSDIDLSKIRTVKHEQESYIVLSELKEMPLEERKQHDSSLSVSPRLLYDQRGYLVGIVSAGTEKWQPRYRQYRSTESLTILVELAGFNESNLSAEMENNVMIVRGERVQLEGSSCVLISEQLQYPIGSFELLISVADDIDNDQVQFDCKDGLLTITCPLRKYLRRRFGQTHT